MRHRWRGTLYHLMIDRCAPDLSGETSQAYLRQRRLLGTRTDPDLYHGGSFHSIIVMIQQNYFNERGYTGLLISCPFKNYDDGPYNKGRTTYHGYHPKNYFLTNPGFGTYEEFLRLLEDAHNHNLVVIMDFVGNHTSPGEGMLCVPKSYRGLHQPNSITMQDLHRYNVVEEGREITLGRATDLTCPHFVHVARNNQQDANSKRWNNIYGRFADLSLAELNQQDHVVDKMLKDCASAWLSCGVDGLRIDAAKHMAQGWMTSFVSHIYDSHGICAHSGGNRTVPTAPFIFAEYAYDHDLQADFRHLIYESGMTILNFRLCGALHHLEVKEVVNKCLEVTNDSVKHYGNLVHDFINFIDHHDLLPKPNGRFLGKFDETNTITDLGSLKLERRTVILMTLPGIPMIYYNTENYSKVVRGDLSVNNANSNNRISRIIRCLSDMRQQHPALLYGSFDVLHHHDEHGILVFRRTFGNDTVIVAWNEGSNPATLPTISVPTLAVQSCTSVLHTENVYITDCAHITIDGNGTIRNSKDSPWKIAGKTCHVWRLRHTTTTVLPEIGSVWPRKTSRNNVITIEGTGFQAVDPHGVPLKLFIGLANKMETAVPISIQDIMERTDTYIRCRIPVSTPVPIVDEDRYYTFCFRNVNGETQASWTGTGCGLKLFSGRQICVRVFIRNVDDGYKSNNHEVYLTGNIPELGMWNLNDAQGPFMHSCSEIVGNNSSTWFCDLNLPEMREAIEVKAVMKKIIKVRSDKQPGENHIIREGIEVKAVMETKEEFVWQPGENRIIETFSGPHHIDISWT